MGSRQDARDSGAVEPGAVLAMVRISSIRVIASVLIAACGALGQQLQHDVSRSSLPDAPSAGKARTSADAACSPCAAVKDAIQRLESSQPIDRPAAMSFALENEESVHTDSGDFLEKHLYLSLLKRNLNYRPSTSGSFMGRATYAASSLVLTRDDFGRLRLNGSYFMGVLSSAFIHTAYSPYWRHSVSEPFSNFGSNIGNDAGMNLFHEFGPGIQQLMRNHAPKFVSKIEERIAPARTPEKSF